MYNLIFIINFLITLLPVNAKNLSYIKNFDWSHQKIKTAVFVSNYKNILYQKKLQNFEKY